MRLDFTTTACCRPEVLCRTYTSFRDKLVGVELCRQTLYLNVDPIPDRSLVPEVERIAKAFFGRVVLNVAREPNFAKAVKWCFSKPETDVFFHLEDDWELLRPYSVEELYQKFIRNPELTSATLRAYDCLPEDDRICLSPGMFRSSHAASIAVRLDIKTNPERQLRPMTVTNPTGGKHNGFMGIQLPREIIVRDIGRDWLERSGWRKTFPVTFNRWERA